MLMTYITERYGMKFRSVRILLSFGILKALAGAGEEGEGGWRVVGGGEV